MRKPRPSAGRREQLPGVAPGAPGDTDRQGDPAVDPRQPASCPGQTAHASGAWKLLVRPVRTAAALALLASSGHAAEPAPAVAGAAGSPSPLAADVDRDLDDVPDRRDNCPNIANAPSPGAGQPPVCGAGFREAIDRFVFLDSRTFLPREGVDPGLELTGGTRHVLLHVKRDGDPAVLSPEQRDRLQAAGVKLWDYLPSHTYYATVPATQAGMAAVAALPFVQGVSALEPRDRIARSVRRARGVPADRQPDGSLQYSVEFFPDVSEQEIARLLGAAGARQTAEDGEERLVEVRGFNDVLALAESDLVQAINDVPGELRNRDDLALAETSTDTVDRVHGFEGKGLKVAMLEPLSFPLPPSPQHPDMANRTIRDSTGVLGDIPEGFEHALEVAGIMVGDGTLDPAKRGFLPESVLINYTDVFPKTARHRCFGYPRQARENHGAVVFNYSVGLLNCNKVGEYHSLGKQIDRSVALTGISIVSAAGNTRGPGGDFAGLDARHGPCEANLGGTRTAGTSSAPRLSAPRCPARRGPSSAPTWSPRPGPACSWPRSASTGPLSTTSTRSASCRAEPASRSGAARTRWSSVTPS